MNLKSRVAGKTDAVSKRQRERERETIPSA